VGEEALSGRYKSQMELLQGTLDLLILQTLMWGPSHGYGIAQAIRANSGELFRVDAGSMYPALQRLQKKKWISATWDVSANKQDVKVYTLTAAGKRQLTEERTRWEQISDAIAGVLNPTAKIES
jgi:PadR family transcriptional regulator PadR